MAADKAGAAALCTVACMPGKAWAVYHAMGAEADGGGAELGSGADWAGIPTCLWPCFEGCVRGGAMPLAVAATRVCASVFWAAVCMSGAVCQLELSPPLYGSNSFTCSFLQLRSPMRSVARGSRDDVVEG